MWLTPARGQQRTVLVHNRQAIWPASEFSDAELVVSVQAQVEESVLLATSQVIRLSYRVVELASHFTIDGSEPVPWREAAAIKGRSFEIMVTSRSAMFVPAQGPRLPNRLAGWLSAVAEDVRAAWPPMPDSLQAGAAWSSPPIVPGGLPAGATSVSIEVGYKAGLVSKDSADVQVTFGLNARLEDPSIQANAAVGEGTMSIHLERTRGPCVVTRRSVLTLIRPRTRDQVVRASVEMSEQPMAAHATAASADAGSGPHARAGTSQPLPQPLDDEKTPA